MSDPTKPEGYTVNFSPIERGWRWNVCPAGSTRWQDKLAAGYTTMGRDVAEEDAAEAVRRLCDKAKAATARAMIDGWTAGEAAARVDLTPGNPFRSAYGAARQLGYEPESAGWHGFVDGYLSAMPPNGVRVDADGNTVGEG